MLFGNIRKSDQFWIRKYLPCEVDIGLAFPDQSQIAAGKLGQAGVSVEIISAVDGRYLVQLCFTVGRIVEKSVNGTAASSAVPVTVGIGGAGCEENITSVDLPGMPECRNLAVGGTSGKLGSLHDLTPDIAGSVEGGVRITETAHPVAEEGADFSVGQFHELGFAGEIESEGGGAVPGL